MIRDSFHSFARNRYYALRRLVFHFKNSLFDQRPKFLLLTYHRVMPEAQFNPLHTIIPYKVFVSQIEQLAKRFPVISLNSAVRQCREGQIRAKAQIVLSFDDGYADNYEFVFAFLKQKGLPGVFFVPTDYMGGSKPLWDWELMLLLNKHNGITSVPSGTGEILRLPHEAMRTYSLRVFRELKSMDPYVRQESMRALKEKLSDTSFACPAEDRFLSWPQLKEMSDAGMEVGSHAISHSSLARMPFEAAEKEISLSKESIESRLHKPCLHFAFPFGSQTDYNDVLVRSVKKAGYQSCMLNVHGYNCPEKDMFCFKRIIMEESVNLKYLLG